MKPRTLHPSLSDIAEAPIRGEIYSIERLEEYALYLAEHLKTDEVPQQRRALLARMKDSGDKLLSAYQTLVETAQNKELLTPASEWLIDNFHIVEEQLREIKEDLPKSYYEELPKVSMGQLAGYPRIYALALALVAHTDSRLEVETVRRFIVAFQTKSYLNIGELWAVAITLRLALVENIRRIALRIVWDRDMRKKADFIADQIEQNVHHPARFKSSVDKISEYCGQKIETEYAFIAQMAKRFRDQELEIWPAAERLDKILSTCNCTLEDIVNLDHQNQAANQVTIANVITSMRLLSNINWQSFFEEVSLLDQDLSEDPTGDYQNMEFATRDEYRHVIERIGKRTLAHERDIARAALGLAQRQQVHVGHYLIGTGLTELERTFHYHPKLSETIYRRIKKWPSFFYLGAIAIVTLLTLVIPLLYADEHQVHGWPALALAVLIVVPGSDLAVSLVNFFLTHILKPRHLPKMDVADSVPLKGRTLVVIPCMLVDSETTKELIEKIEVHYLGNDDDEVFFALVTDYVDAETETKPHDASLVHEAREGIVRLNATYSSERDRFFLFHRRRKWNAAEGKWMGWERKRGKIHELNRLLRGAQDTSYEVATAPKELLPTFKFVITLDADTQLGLNATKKLIGTALHPLNRPRLDTKTGRVIEGYGVIQPRISISLESSSQSRFAAIFSGHTGIDPYTTAVSDVYQDLFNEGSFTGKGLYDIDAFEASLKDRVPENTVLSHDLFEGLHARAALATDIELLDDYPSTYTTFVQRQHRWVRGDWQIARWMFPKVPNAFGQRIYNDLPLISRWKIYDNLRRSLVAFCLFLMYLAGWFILPGDPLFWTALATGVVALPCFLHVANGLFINPRGMPWSSGFWSELGQVRISLAQFFLSLAFLPHKAYVEVDALFRALYRTEMSKEKCLEWVASAQVGKMQGQKKKAMWQKVWPFELGIFIVLIAVFFLTSLQTWAIALPFLILWALYPVVSKWSGRPWQKQSPDLSAGDKVFLQDIARRIWLFFETYVGAKDNWLPPDNIQEDPSLVVAHRTSPTNIGLYALSVLVARDMGYLSLRSSIERLNLMMRSVQKLEKYRGHLLNWYDTQKLEPLYPKYVSVVDSGNLAGYLLVLKQSILEMQRKPVFQTLILEGMVVTLSLIEEELHRLQGQKQRTGAISAADMVERIEECRQILTDHAPISIQAWARFIFKFKRAFDDIRDNVAALELEHGARYYQGLRSWVDSMGELLDSLEREVRLFYPWVFEPLLELDLRGHPEWLALKEQLNNPASLIDTPHIYASVSAQLRDLNLSHIPAETLEAFKIALAAGAFEVNSQLESMNQLRDTCEKVFDEMDFSFLIDRDREVFHIGYNVSESRPDNAYYDLLASEARLASFVAIIKGDVEQKHWFRLGRQLVPVEGKRALVSWSASMFEYLMPQLVMVNYPNTLLYETMDAVVRRQISYGKKLKVPWGISEAGYNARDLNFNYQYGPFGIPGMGLKRGLGHDVVVSPYSTFLAGLVEPGKAVKNLRTLTQQNLLTRFGFYESIDYTPERLSSDQKYSVIHSFMAHHQGMSLVAIDNTLHDNIMQKRFHEEPRVRAAELLLQEKIPFKVKLAEPKAAAIEWADVGESQPRNFDRIYTDATHHSPRVQILSNGSYSLMLSTAGSGYSKWEGMAVTRWREDATRDQWGSYIFVRDLKSNESWSTSFQPNLRQPDSYKAIFAEDKVEFWREDGELRTHCQVIVAPEDNLELRQVAVTNDSFREKIVEITTYMEPVLATLAEDSAHPAFSNLFLQTEFLASKQSLLSRRRPRSSNKKEVWSLHGVVTDNPRESELEYETDRSRFVGRGRTLANPLALNEGIALSNTVGSTLDPIMSLRIKLRIPPGQTRKVLFTTGIAFAREDILMMADRYHDLGAFERESHMAWTKSRIDLRHLGMDSDAAYLFQRLAERILYLDPSLRQPSHFLAEHTREQASLWPYGISGDLPIVVLIIEDKKDLGMIRTLLRGHEYLRLKGLSYDFVILNDGKNVYLQDLQEEILRQIRGSGSHALLNRPGGIFALRLDTMPERDRALIQAMARVVLSPEWGSLKEQVARKVLPERYSPAFVPSEKERAYSKHNTSLPELTFFNGLGGFASDGKEYLIYLKEGQWTPAPWINVIANSHDFGFQVSDSGAGFTWAVNSRENRLTPWSNDPVSDPQGEIIYLRDEQSGEVWSPTPAPVRTSELYVVRHGQGYSKFEHTEKGISSYLMMFVPTEDSVKISHLRLKNISGRKRKIALWAYVEWVLGNSREKSAPYVLTEADATKTIFAKNSYNHEFAERISFFKVVGDVHSLTCDRKEFIGRNGSLAFPEALRRQGLAGRTGIGLDPCGALQRILEIPPGDEVEVTILLGQADNKEKAQGLIGKYSDVKNVEAAYYEVCAMWDEILGKVEVKAPDLATDFMMNRWLLYQAMVCRLWARSAFYQSGGAYGFRDQLQDCMAFVYSAPALARSHILRASARQFPEGDVQHWWHPPTGRGVRTHFSDDLLWLPFVVSHYIRVTGDHPILQEETHFIEAPLLSPEQEDSYTQPQVSPEKSSLLDHCLRTIEHSMRLGAHGLPLIGSGDWNDGMNRVGEKGRGESVWMAWFLHKVMEDFLPYCDHERQTRYKEHMQALKTNVEAQAWDGQWYRRAYFDDGTPLGTKDGLECRIDSLSQSWSVLSQAGDHERRVRAMQSVAEHLILKDKQIIQLLTPPFDKTPLDPGYIKGYVPGVRENGGQYTHAALWVMMAYAELGDTSRVYEIFNMLNPIQHGRNKAGAQKYKIEPYVVAADIYAVEPHVGRGGWSWYTGSASWFYRAGLESLLGVQIFYDHIRFRPCIPAEWKSFDVKYRHKKTTYQIRVENVSKASIGKVEVLEGGRMISSEGLLPLIDDGETHAIIVRI